MDQRSRYSNLPKKRMAAGAVIFNSSDELLIVKPTYRDAWLVPGGIIEREESPRNACVREVREEIGIEVNPERLLCVEYRSADERQTEALYFLFFCGRISDREIGRIQLASDEIEEYQFASRDIWMSKLALRLAQRTALALTAIEDNRTIYIEDGRAVF